MDQIIARIRELLFGRPTVATITQSMTQLIERLEAHSDAEEARAMGISTEITRLGEEQNVAYEEADRADTVATKLRDLFAAT